MQAARQIGVDDAVDEREVVYRLAVSLGVKVGAAPLEVRRAVPARHEIVSAKVHPPGLEAAELRQQLLAVATGGVVGLVRAEEAPYRCQGA